MNWQPIPTITAPHYNGATLNEVQKLSNGFMVKDGESLSVRNMFGYSKYADHANYQACRGSFYSTIFAHVYTAHANTINRTNGLGIFEFGGGLDTSSGNVVWCSNSSKIMMVDGTSGYVIDPVAATWAKIVDVNFPSSPVSCACFNGQFIVCKGGTDRWYMSAVDDPTTWTPVISGRTLLNPDNIYHVEVVNDNIYFFSSSSIETWYPSSVDPYLTPITGATFPIGIVGSSSVARIGNTIYFHGISFSGKGGFYKLSGGQVEKISTSYMDTKIQEWVFGANEISCSAFMNYGQEFFQFYTTGSSNSFPRWMYNATTGTWSELTTNHNLAFIKNTLLIKSSRIITFGFDTTNASIYFLGTELDPRWTFNSVANNFTLDFEVEAGIYTVFNSGMRLLFEVLPASGGTYSLSVLLQKTDDGGKSFDTGITISKSFTAISAIAQYVTIQTPPLGSFRSGRTYRMTIANPQFGFMLQKADGLIKVGRF